MDRAPATLHLWVGVCVLSHPAVLGYIVSSFQPISLQLVRKGEFRGTGGKEARCAHPLPPPTSVILFIPVRGFCKMAARKGW